jgi:hypothetical protein
VKNNTAVLGGGMSESRLASCEIVSNTASFEGGGAWLCVISNCDVIGNATPGDGGGMLYGEAYKSDFRFNTANAGGAASDAEIHHCTIWSNATTFRGGGVVDSFVYNTLVNGNYAPYGGGAFGSLLYNCTVVNNVADDGGGVSYGDVYNSIVYFNAALSGENYSGGTFDHSCTYPDPGSAGNITNDPLFVDLAAGDFRLLSNSPCIDGSSPLAWMTNAMDLAGETRVKNLFADMGAYEFQGKAMAAAWLQQYGLPTDGSAISSSDDGDGYDNWLEYMWGTDPTNDVSFPGLILPDAVADTGLVVRFRSEEGRLYHVERSIQLNAAPAFTLLASNIVGAAGSTAITDTPATITAPVFYRVYIVP